jgi:hypothetical protein
LAALENLGRTPVTNSTAAPLPAALLEALALHDTPTICNALEIVAPERRLIGYTRKPLVCPFPDLPPIVGYARTTTIRSVAASGLPAAEQQARRLAYYEYVGTGHGPRINVIQDIDGADAGFGAFWGEVQSAVHKALGCLGVITDGSIRDIAQWAPGFQALAGSIGPSHAFVHAESFGGEVRVAGMTSFTPIVMVRWSFRSMSQRSCPRLPNSAAAAKRLFLKSRAARHLRWKSCGRRWPGRRKFTDGIRAFSSESLPRT